MERTPARSRGLWLALALLAGVLLLAVRQPAHADSPPDALPDLVADPPSGPKFDNSVDSTNNSSHLLLRFDGYIHNIGAGALELRGSRVTSNDPMVPLQRIYQSGGSGSRDDPMPASTELQYSTADGHNHWHFQRVATYSLWNYGRTASGGPGMKVGFCMLDSQYVEATSTTPHYGGSGNPAVCGSHAPDALSIYEGISSGWRDGYWSSLAFQWVDVSEVQPGDYWLREDVDPNNIIKESNDTNAPGWSNKPVTIPGFVAKAITAQPLPYGQLQQVSLDATVHGQPGARAFRIVTPPAHGTLNVATGSTFTGPSVTYRPAIGYSGADQFTYEALDSTSSYPLHPGTATVALSVAATPAPRVVIENAPTAVQTGNGVQLHATVSNDFPGVTWSVDGVDGGATRSGTITAGGFYRAPSDIPPGGHVTIAARSASGGSDSRKVAIVFSAPPGASPGTKGSKKSKGILGSIATALDGRLVAASVTPKRAGKVWITGDIGRHRVASCKAKTPKHRKFTCRTHVATGLDLKKLKLVARLIRDHRVVARVVRVGAP